MFGSKISIYNIGSVFLSQNSPKAANLACASKLKYLWLLDQLKYKLIYKGLFCHEVIMEIQ